MYSEQLISARFSADHFVIRLIYEQSDKTYSIDNHSGY